MLTRNDHWLSNASRMPEAMAVADGMPGWPPRRIRTDGCSGAAAAAAAEPSQAPTIRIVSDHARRWRPDRIAEHDSTATWRLALRRRSSARACRGRDPAAD